MAKSSTTPSASTPDSRRPDPARPHQRRRLLAERVLASLVDSGYASLAFIDCDLDDERVILLGSVPSYHLKQLAQVYAQRVEGVGQIDNRLEVRRLELRGRGPR